ncbi:MAG: VOC family protein, partial [Cellulosimicrobium funkei]
MAHGDITHIDIPVSDNGRATQFYGELFGWEIAEVPGFEGYPMWQAPNKISGGGLAPRSEGFTSPRSYVEV